MKWLEGDTERNAPQINLDDLQVSHILFIYQKL